MSKERFRRGSFEPRAQKVGDRVVGCFQEIVDSEENFRTVGEFTYPHPDLADIKSGQLVSWSQPYWPNDTSAEGDIDWSKPLDPQIYKLFRQEKSVARN